MAKLKIEEELEQLEPDEKVRLFLKDKQGIIVAVHQHVLDKMLVTAGGSSKRKNKLCAVIRKEVIQVLDNGGTVDWCDV